MTHNAPRILIMSMSAAHPPTSSAILTCGRRIKLLKKVRVRVRLRAKVGGEREGLGLGEG